MADPLPELRRFFQELKRRRVVRVAAVYVAVAWLVIEGADVIFPALQLPEWTVSFVVGLAILSLPIALVLAWAFDVTPEGVRRTPSLEEGIAPDPSAPGSPASASASEAKPWHARPGVWFVAGLLVTLAATWFLANRDGSEPGTTALDENGVAVLPFRVASADSDLQILREGMVDLLATKLTGETGMRAVDSRTTLRAWHSLAGEGDRDLPQDSARLVGERVGAGRIMLGEVVSASGRVTLNASVIGVADGERQGRFTVEGEPDSLTTLVDELAAGLLTLEAGEGERLSQLTSTSLSGLRLYLEGESAYRRGEYSRALELFDAAIEADSTFALAALGIVRAATWLTGEKEARRRADALRWAMAERDRLSARDRQYLEAFAIQTFASPEPYPVIQQLDAWEAVVEERRDDAEAWFWFGDVLYHLGYAVDVEDSWDRAERAFERAYELDPTFMGPLEHRLDLNLRRDRPGPVERLEEEYLGHEPEGFVDVRRAQLTVLYGDSVEYERLLAVVDTLPHSLLRSTVEPYRYLLRSSRYLEFAARVYDVLPERAETREERREAWEFRREFALNRGRPADALEDTEQLEAEVAGTEPLRMKVTDALYWDGDSTAAAGAAEELRRTVDAPDANRGAASEERARDLCVLAQWEVHQGETQPAEALIPELTGLVSDTIPAASSVAAVCARLVEALVAVHEDRPDAGEAVDRLDSLLGEGPPDDAIRHQGNLSLARLLERRGEHAAALRTVRRFRVTPARDFQSTVLRIRGRLAAEVGERQEAIDVYREYLSLRSEPEQTLEDEVAQVERELEELLGDRNRGA